MPNTVANKAWYRRLEASRRYRDRHRAEWASNRSLLLGTVDKSLHVRREDAVNLAWAAFQTMIGQAYAQNSRPIIRGKTGGLELTARMLTQVVEDDLEQMSVRYATRLAIADVFWAGFGMVMEKLQGDVTSATFRYSGSETTLPAMANQRYSLTRVHPESILVDPVGVLPTMMDHKWAALEFYPTVKELLDDPMFDVDREMVEKLPSVSQAPSLGRDEFRKTNDPRSNEEDDEFRQIRVYEIWDRVNREVLYCPFRSDVVIGKRPWPVELRYHGELLFPWAILYFNENPDEFYPIPEMSMAAPQIRQYQTLFRHMLMDSVTKFRKFVVQAQFLQKGHMARLLSGPPNSVIAIDSNKLGATPEQVRPENIVWPIPDVSIKQDVIAALNYVKRDLHEIIGAGDFASGGLRNTRSATEAAALSDFLRVRMSNRTENIDAFFKQLVTIHVLYLQETATEDRMSMVTDLQGVPQWKTFNRENIQGDFLFSVVAGSSMPANTETVRQENLAFYQQTLPVVQASGGNVAALIEWIAPFYKMPQYLVDKLFNGHKQALQQLALMFLGAHAGVKYQGGELMNAIAGAVQTGLTQAELAQVAQGLAEAQQSQQQAQPGGLPGTNTSDQSV